MVAGYKWSQDSILMADFGAIAATHLPVSTVCERFLLPVFKQPLRVKQFDSGQLKLDQHVLWLLNFCCINETHRSVIS